MKTLAFGICVALSVISFSCASTVPNPIFAPRSQEGVTYFYRDGRPFVATSLDSVLISFVVDYSVKLAGQDYIRVWLLAQNNSSSDFLLDPWSSFRLVPVFENRSIDTLIPIARTQILSSIDNEQVATHILQTIGSTLKALSTEPTTISDSRGNKVQLNDRQEKLDVVARESRASMANTASLYAAFKASVNAGVIRRNTLFPGEGIHGFIYFPKPIPAPYYEGIFDFTKYDLTMKITTSRGAKRIYLFRSLGD